MDRKILPGSSSSGKGRAPAQRKNVQLIPNTSIEIKYLYLIIKNQDSDRNVPDPQQLILDSEHSFR